MIHGVYILSKAGSLIYHKVRPTGRLCMVGCLFMGGALVTLGSISLHAQAFSVRREAGKGNDPLHSASVFNALHAMSKQVRAATRYQWVVASTPLTTRSPAAGRAH